MRTVPRHRPDVPYKPGDRVRITDLYGIPSFRGKLATVEKVSVRGDLWVVPDDTTLLQKMSLGYETLHCSTVTWNQYKGGVVEK